MLQPTHPDHVNFEVFECAIEGHHTYFQSCHRDIRGYWIRENLTRARVGDSYLLDLRDGKIYHAWEQYPWKGRIGDEVTDTKTWKAAKELIDSHRNKNEYYE